MADDSTSLGKARLRRLRFRAWHRGTREADLVLGPFIDARLAGLSDAEIAWLERLMEQPDSAIMAWILGKETPPASFDTPLMAALKRLDYLGKGQA
ncbi:MAG: succinate dehydrogenase assembly factor 2 [Pseudomonadota bacterium]